MAVPQWFAAVKKKLQLVASAALSVSASDTAGSQFDISDADRISGIWVSIEAIAGTSATITVRLQHSPDGGRTWFDTGMTTAALTLAQGVQQVLMAITCDLFPMIRCKALLSTSTTPTATYSAWLGYCPRTEGPPRAS